MFESRRFKPGSILEGYSKFRIFETKYLDTFILLIKKEVFDIGAGLATYNMNDLKKLSMNILLTTCLLTLL